MNLLWDRPQRVDYRVPVTLGPPGTRSAVPGSALNLSVSGMLVRVFDPYPIGTELICTVPLRGQARELVGRVAWVRADPHATGAGRGMGIQFVKLSAQDAAALRETVERDREARVDIWLEGEGHPRPSGARLQRSTTDRGSPIYEVALAANSGPMAAEGLNLPCSLEPEILPATRRRRQMVLSGMIDVRPQKTPPWRQEPSVQVPRQNGERVVEHGARPPDAIAIPESTPLLEQLTFQLPLDDGRFAAVKRRPWSGKLVVGAIGLVALVIVGSLVGFDLWRDWDRRAALLKQSNVSALVLPMDDTTFSAGDLQPVDASGLLAGEDEELQAAPAVEATSETPGEETEEDEIPEPVDTRERDTTTTPPARSLVQASRADPSPGPGRGSERKPKLQIDRQGGEVILTIPIAGSARSAQTYPLVAPDGLAVNLPHARATLPHGVYPLHRNGFRLAWIKKRGQGIHVRVLFDASASKRHRLLIRAEAIHVHLTSASPRGAVRRRPLSAGTDQL
jgi:hypothetical protein